MKMIRNAALFVATALVLLHSIVPHVHHSDLTSSQDKHMHEEASSIMDFLALAFHLDHSDGNLENYVNSASSCDLELDQIILDLPSEIFNIELSSIPIDSERSHFCFIYNERGHSCSSPPELRGPPSLS